MTHNDWLATEHRPIGSPVTDGSVQADRSMQVPSSIEGIADRWGS